MMDRTLKNISPVMLEGHGITLEPLSQEHLPGLEKAAESAEIWPYMTTNLAEENTLGSWLEEAQKLEQVGQQLPFAIRLSTSGTVIGSTRFLNIVPEHRRLEIGWTWLTREQWGGRANFAAKLLLFQHAFEVLNAQRVELRTDALNKRARRAIAKLGATEEGTLRSHMIMPGGRVRNSVQFAIIDTDWPRVKAALTARLNNKDSA
jgi:RimJ/RimL family protein N-acetyltransferase